MGAEDLHSGGREDGRHLLGLAAPDRLSQIGQDNGDADGGEHDVNGRSTLVQQEPDQEFLQSQPQEEHDHHGQQKCHYEGHPHILIKL
jgi:hypothetical protein